MEVTEETDPASWDQLIRQLGGHPLQSSAWGTLKSRFGWRAVRLATADRSAAAQLLVRPLAGLAIAYIPRGPVTSGQADTDDALLAAIEQRARRHRAAFVRIEPHASDESAAAPPLDALLRARRYRSSARTIQPRASLVLDLTPPPAELWASFSKGHRADARRAEREGVSVRVGTDADVAQMQRLLEATQQRKAFGIHSLAYHRELLRLFGDDARLLIAEHESAAVAATIALAWGAHGIYLVAGSSRAGLEHRAGHLLQWHAIQWARERGARSYDLWGIPDARARLEQEANAAEAERRLLDEQARLDPLDGVYRFKKGWGASAVRFLPAYDRVHFPPAYWLWQRRRGGEA